MGLANGGLFRNMTGMSLEITEELIARQSPEAHAIIRALLAQIQQLQDRLNQSPRNSSAPPSTEHPHARPPRPKPPATRRRGGQAGHPRHERPLLPSGQCGDVIPLKPATCRRCGRELSGEDAAPLRHQVWELPEIKPQVVEYRRHRLACLCCGKTTCATLPPGVPAGQSGPRLLAFTRLLMAYFRQSKRRTALFLETLLNQPCCPALTVKMQAQVTQALRPAYEELASALPSQPHLRIDESPTKEATTKAWLWTFVAGLFTVDTRVVAVRTANESVLV
jgi:transposase